jgi:class 3 adenylate cyclase/tetratricopeptide (TPR) repeat protein
MQYSRGMVEPARRERKLVTVVFVDLVGFTSRAETLDPEDVEAFLKPYLDRVRGEQERFGGTVEKFIGDAVMAVFGAPQAHEDDPERAVRAALAIRDWAVEEHVDVRIGVNTGEVLVSLDARLEAGESLVTGDVVNTASRLQSGGPVNGILVGAQTYRATRQVIDYREAEPVLAKGKAEPVPAWEALQARARIGVDARQLSRAKLVGRGHELGVLRDVLARVRDERLPWLITLVGVPGIGKSRLVFELLGVAEKEPELIFWRQGRCLPYGDGVSLWALAEVMKAHAGILETDSTEDAESKLRRAVIETAGEGPDAEWVIGHMRPLVGLPGDGSGSAGRSSESFFAWRRFLEAIAAKRPLVLVLEDLHWADDRFLDFVAHLLEWTEDVPMLMLCTARPELLSRRPGWGSGKPNAVSLQLSPLSDEETAELLLTLLEQDALPGEMKATLLDRAGGNPLYAEEFARMVADRGSTGGFEPLPLPDTVQGVIAARVDGLPPEEKQLLQDGAIMGKIFWTGSVAAIGDADRWSLEERLRVLQRKEFLRRERRSSVGGESEYAFLHVLVRDVAYGSIPRPNRAAKHRLAAEWIESLSKDRTEDHAELLAYHYGQALELARASGALDEAWRLEEPARRFLILAGDHALRLDVARADSYYRQALNLVPARSPDRARIAAKVADAAQEDGRLREAVRGYDEAIPELRAQGDSLKAGASMVRLSFALWRLGDTDRSRAVIAEAIDLLEREPPGPELARAYGRMGANHLLAGRSREGIEWSEKALALAEKLGVADLLVRAHMTRGMARNHLGDWEGLEDLREALRLGLELGLGIETAMASLNLGEHIASAEGPAEGLEILRESIDFAERRGMTHHVVWTRTASTWMLFQLGRWDELLRIADEVIDWDLRGGGSQIAVFGQMIKASVLAWRGEVTEAGLLVNEFLPRARSIGDVQVLGPALTTAALAAKGQGDLQSAVGLIQEFEEVTRDRRAYQTAELTTDAFRISSEAGALDLGQTLLARVAETAAPKRRTPIVLTGRAVLAEARKELESAASFYAQAAAGWGDLGHVLERALALLGLGRCRLGLGRAGEAAEPLGQARELLIALGARPAVAEANELLEQATAHSP